MLSERKFRALRLHSTLFAAVLALAVALFAPAGHASGANVPQPVLVELFTSEGCSSCPPADRLLMDLDRSQPVAGARIIVLSEDVDYWNSLGWRDPYSSQQWSRRQDEYGRRFRLDSVYTPQMIIDGARQENGSDRSAVQKAVRESAGSPKIGLEIVSAIVDGDRLMVHFTASASNAVLYAVLADESDRSTVARGENAGRTLDHVAVARSLERIATMHALAADDTVSISLPSPIANRPLRLILFAQDEKTGHIFGVVERRL